MKSAFPFGGRSFYSRGKRRDVRIRPWATTRWQARGECWIEYADEECFPIWRALILQQQSCSLEARGFVYMLSLSPSWQQLHTNTGQVRGLQFLPCFEPPQDRLCGDGHRSTQ